MPFHLPSQSCSIERHGGSSFLRLPSVCLDEEHSYGYFRHLQIVPTEASLFVKDEPEAGRAEHTRRLRTTSCEPPARVHALKRGIDRVSLPQQQHYLALPDVFANFSLLGTGDDGVLVVGLIIVMMGVLSDV
jgi:hypothetical protein